MSQSETAQHLEELRDETARLQIENEELKYRLSQYEEVEARDDESSTRNDVSPWSEWPYCWFIDAFGKTSERFHCFHENLAQAKLTRQNKRAQQVFSSQNDKEIRELELM